MRRLLANVMLAGLGLALPAWAFGQAAPPVIAAAPSTLAKTHKAMPVWQQGGNTISVTANGGSTGTVPAGPDAVLTGQSRFTGAGVKVTTKPGLTAHAGVQEIQWAPLALACATTAPGAPSNPACLGAVQSGVQRGEVGAGFAGRDVKFDVSLRQSQSQTGNARTRARSTLLPRVLPSADGADVAAPLWFRNSTSTDIAAHGQVRVARDTHLEVGASVGRVHFLPAAGLAGENNLDQTTLSFGIQHGPVRGMVVGHMLEPSLPGGLDASQRWSGVDLGISVRLPWRGELNFGAQNVWTSGSAPLLFGPAGATPAQGRVPYVQYHQDL